MWNLENIKIAIERYKTENGRYPSTLDFDKTEYLPTSRLIQRNFGGIVKLRQDLQLETPANYTKGAHRSEIAKNTFASGAKYEDTFYNYLIGIVPEIRVHEHKILRPGRVCCDFYIYNTSGQGIAIDIFFAKDMFSVARIVGIKQKRYVNLAFKTLFILVGNDQITQIELDRLAKNKKNELGNIEVMTELFFKENINRYVN